MPGRGEPPVGPDPGQALRRELPEPVARVARFLTESRAEARLQELRGETAGAEEAAKAIGCRLEQIVKSLLFMCDGRPVLVMVPGSRRADPVKVARASGAKVAQIAPSGVAREVTGFDVGGIAPFPLARVDVVLADRSLLTSTVLWVGAGSSRHLAALAPPELLRLARAEAADVCLESGPRLTRLTGA